MSEYSDTLKLIDKLEISLSLEEEKSFTNFQGRSRTFAEFMQVTLPIIEQNIKSINFLYQLKIPLNKIQNLVKLYKFYPSNEVTQRLYLVKTSISELQSLKSSLLSIKDLIEKTQDTSTNTQPQNIWEIDVKWVPGIGDKLARTLEKVNIYTVYDLLSHLPRKHLDFGDTVQIANLKNGMDVTIIGQITHIHVFCSPRNPNLHILNIDIADGSGKISISKFWAGKSGKYLSSQFKSQYPKGSIVIAYGTTKAGKKTKYELTNYSLELIDANTDENIDLTSYRKIIPAYPLTEGISQEYFRKIIHNALTKYSKDIPDTLPDDIIEQYSLISLSKSIQEIHQPSSQKSLEDANKRLAFEEFLFMQLPLVEKELNNRRKSLNNFSRNTNLIHSDLIQRFLNNLPFELTNAQKRVFNQISTDLNSSHPMARLIQGDVGSGKTIIAILAMLIAVERGYQATIMAPTEILADQHYRKCQQWLTSLGIRTALLTGSLKTSIRKDILAGLQSGEIHIAVGTHALIQDSVSFHNLGLAVVDEQHRFGVQQREKLRDKGAFDNLYMTATPIPRTMALSLYGNLSLSEIDELPPGRKPIETHLITAKDKKSLHKFIKEQIDKGAQAYIVYPLIAESESLSANAALEEYEKLVEVYKGYNLGIIHGKLLPYEKEQVMNDFRKKKIDLLIGTTVIEVGVDVPNATTMVIENAERFGLAQLHQLRGRVGRGEQQSYCFLVSTSDDIERLQIMEQTEDGFIIAQKDLELRGPGELLGTRQSGVSDFGLARLLSHGYLLEMVKELTHALINNNLIPSMPELFQYKYQNAQDKLSLS